VINKRKGHNMTVSKASMEAAAIQQHTALVRDEERHGEKIANDRHIKERLMDNELHRIEANRRMLRAGQNIDKLA
jgi:hypothetical protein